MGQWRGATPSFDGPEDQGVEPSNGLLSRRALIRMSLVAAAGQTLGLGCSEPAKTAPASVLLPGERATLAAIADTLVPGSSHAGVVDFVAAMLADTDPMLCYRFLSVPMPPLTFYKASLAAIADLSVKAMGRNPDALSANQRTALVGTMLSPNAKAWKGPPAALVYFVIRNDAIDAVYGDERAYARLDVPYMAHIEPPARW
jgi:Gluconate 2-dehydrogenase subunit 3